MNWLKSMFEKKKEKEENDDPATWEELQSYHQACAERADDEIQRLNSLDCKVKEEDGEETVIGLSDQESRKISRLVKERDTHYEFVRHYADKIEERESSNKSRKNNIVGKVVEGVAKVGAVFGGIFLTYKLEEKTHVIPNSRADKFIPKA